MINISKQQKFDRWDTLSDNLKGALFSEQNSSILWRICEGQHLPADKISTVAVITGYIILGFIHAEDLAKEIKNELNINQEIANTIALEIDRKIFGPIRSDLEKIYSIPVEEKGTETEALDLRAKAQALEVSEIRPIEAIVAVAEAPKIIPEEKPGAIKTPEISPTPAIQVDGPMIIHKETEFKPLSESRKSLGGLFGFLKKDREQKPETMTAAKVQVELGSQPLGVSEASQEKELEPSKVAKTEIPKVRVVHYTEFPVAANPFPIEGEKPKEVIQSVPLQTEKQEIKPSENLPTNLPTEIEIPNPPEVIIEKKVMPGEKQPDKIVPAQTLDLRQVLPEIKPALEKPSVESPKTSPAKSEDEIIDLGMFK